MTIDNTEIEHFNLFPGAEVFKRLLEPECPFGQFVYDKPLCCLKREGPDPYCDKENCPKLKGIKKCKPIPKICDSCPANPKTTKNETVPDGRGRRITHLTIHTEGSDHGV